MTEIFSHPSVLRQNRNPGVCPEEPLSTFPDPRVQFARAVRIWAFPEGRKLLRVRPDEPNVEHYGRSLPTGVRPQRSSIPGKPGAPRADGDRNGTGDPGGFR